MRDVRTNAELQAFHTGGDGLVFNHFTSGPAGARDNVLHTAGCPQVARMLIRARPENRPSVRKVLFATVEEARSWLTASLGPEGHGWKSCTRCQPGGAAERTPPPAPRAVPVMADAGAPSSAARGTRPGSWPADAAFAMPASPPLRLPVPPRLASWNRARYPLLVIDEVGYIPFEPEAANLFFQLVSSRYERASLIVTSNKPFGRWGEVFGDDTVAAMIDRLVHHADVIALKGDSYRLKDRDLGRVPAATSEPG